MFMKLPTVVQHSMNREHQRQARPDRHRPDLRWTRGLFRTHRSHLSLDHRLNRLRSLLLQAPAKIASQPRRHRILWIYRGMPYLLRSSLLRRNAATAMAVLPVRLHRRCACADQTTLRIMFAPLEPRYSGSPQTSNCLVCVIEYTGPLRSPSMQSLHIAHNSA